MRIFLFIAAGKTKIVQNAYKQVIYKIKMSQILTSGSFMYKERDRRELESQLT